MHLIAMLDNLLPSQSLTEILIDLDQVAWPITVKNNNLCANLLLKDIKFRNLEKLSMVNDELHVYQNSVKVGCWLSFFSVRNIYI